MTVPCRRPAVAVDMMLGRSPQHLAGRRLDGDGGAGPLAPGQATREVQDAVEDTGTPGHRLEIAGQHMAPERLARGGVERTCYRPGRFALGSKPRHDVADEHWRTTAGTLDN